MLYKICVGLLVLCLTACNFSEETDSETSNRRFETTKGAGIDSLIRAEITAKNDLLIPAIVKNQPEEILKLTSDYLINNDPLSFHSVIEQASELVQNFEYAVFSEYYTKTSTPEIPISFCSGACTRKDTNDFEITYSSPNKESYVSLLYSNSGHGARLVTAIYSKYAHDWKLDYLHFSNYSLYGQTGPEFYYSSKKAYENNNLLGAYTLALLSQTCINPAGEIFEYDLQTEIEAYNEKIANEVAEKYQFPITVDQIPTKPLLMDISVVPLDGYQYFPMISYVSQTDLTDEDAYHDECDALNSKIWKILPGFSWKFDLILYYVTDKIPEPGVEVQSQFMLKPIQ